MSEPESQSRTEKTDSTSPTPASSTRDAAAGDSAAAKSKQRAQQGTRGGEGASSQDPMHRSVKLPHLRGRWHWFVRWFAFTGPALMVAVGYMDPGNWATDIEGGARFGYSLIWVLLASNLMAVLLQTLAVRLGIVGQRDLAQACRQTYHPALSVILFGLCEVAIIATDLAELLGTAIGLNLLLGIPLIPAVLITGGDVILLLTFQHLGVRKMEAFVLALVATIAVCFGVELVLSEPSVTGIAGGFVPRPLSGHKLYIAIGILGATVMPHNLYLHSALVRTRDVKPNPRATRQACRYNLIDATLALNLAFLVNAAILILAAATFWRNALVVTEIQQAHRLLDDVLGSSIAPAAFAIALICAGQSSTLTGTLAGQVTMEGFLRLRMRPWLRRFMTRMLAIIPAVIAIGLLGNQGTYKLLILSQVILSLQLPFAVVPLVRFTSSRAIMGRFVNPRWVKVLAWLITAVIIGLNGQLAYTEITGWADAAAGFRWLVLALAIPLALGLAGLLAWLVFKPDQSKNASAS